MIDVLVVGSGLAGMSFCEVLEENNKTFLVVADDSQRASQVAGGLYNPVILKRFTLAWNAAEQLKGVVPFYTHLEEKLKLKLHHRVPVLRRFASIEEQNQWFEAMDTPQLQTFLSPKIRTNTNTSLEAPYGYGEVMHTGRVDTKKLLAGYGTYLDDRNLCVHEPFDFDALKIGPSHFGYKSIRAKHIVFATGYGLKQNPYFNYLPLTGTKGELLTIEAPELKEHAVIKSSVFLIPLGRHRYLVGATYKWKDKTNTPTLEARTELLEKLDTFLNCDYEVVAHVAGIRPTVTDRRPLVGRHPQHDQMYVLNGLGSRGVMIAPYAAKLLYQNMEYDLPLPKEMDVARFSKKYVKG
ncbi:FAD-dependent oxidoreductase [Flavobacteriaceae bacterium 3-367]